MYVFILSRFTVLESREIPPLPVSSIKFRESLKSSRPALIRIIPPVRILKGNFVMNADGDGTNSSWACSEVMDKASSSGSISFKSIEPFGTLKVGILVK